MSTVKSNLINTCLVMEALVGGLVGSFIGGEIGGSAVDAVYDW